MPTDKPRVTFALEPEMLEKIEDYRFKNRAKNQSQAIVSLIEKGLQSLRPELIQKEETPALESTEVSIPVEESTAVLVELGYIRPGQQLTQEDLALLSLISYVMDRWFESKEP